MKLLTQMTDFIIQRMKALQEFVIKLVQVITHAISLQLNGTTSFGIIIMLIIAIRIR